MTMLTQETLTIINEDGELEEICVECAVDHAETEGGYLRREPSYDAVSWGWTIPTFQDIQEMQAEAHSEEYPLKRLRLMV